MAAAAAAARQPLQGMLKRRFQQVSRVGRGMAWPGHPGAPWGDTAAVPPGECHRLRGKVLISLTLLGRGVGRAQFFTNDQVLLILAAVVAV